MNVISNSIQRYKNMQIEAKASIWYTLCNILQKGISFIVIPIYVRVLTTGEYGKYTVFQSWRDVLIIFATLNLYCGIFTKAMVDYDDDRDVYTSCMQGLSTVITVFTLAVYLLFSGYWDRLFDMDTTTMLMMFGYFITFPAFNFWTVRKKVENKYVSMVAITMLVTVATPVISLILLITTNMRENAVIQGYLLVQIAVGIYFYIYQFIRGKVFYHKKYWIHGIKYNIPLIPHYLSLIVLGQIDRIMIKKYCGNDKAGIYSLAYQLATIMSIFVNAINASLIPWIYGKLKVRDIDSIKRTSRLLCILIAIVTMINTLIAPEVVMIVGTSEYRQAIWLIPSVSLSVYFTFCYNLFANVEFYYNETRYVMIASMVGAVLNILLNIIFIPRYGFLAAGYTTLVCYFVFMIMHYLFMRKICRKEKLGSYVYDNRAIGLISIVLFILSLLSMLIYDIVIARYLIIVVLSVVLFKNKKYLLRE